VLVCTLGGTSYKWTSPLIIVLGIVAVAVLVAFVVYERRTTAEPVLPPRLFGNRVFAVTSAIGFVVGFALFGSVTYLPLFLQVVNGASPTGSGLQILPLMAGLLVTSIGSGQLISRTGVYKPFPIIGTAVMVVGLLLLSGMSAQTSRLVASLDMFVLGLGLGMVMQVLVLAVQNAVDYKDLGVATSGATLFRSIGGSIGTAILGSIFSNRLGSELVKALPSGASSHLTGSAGTANPAALDRLPAPIHHAYILAFTNALGTVFAVAAVVAAVGFLLSWALEQRPLRDTINAGSGIGETFAMPKDTASLAEASRALTVLVGREGRRQLVQRLADRAGVDLSPAACWLIVRLDEDPRADVAALCRSFDIPEGVGSAALEELQQRDLVRVSAPEVRELTPAGEETVAKLLAERRASLARLCDGWEPEENTELTGLLTRLARDLAREPSHEVHAHA
jgi:DNA-binding MarR family transcriptional regulator